MTTFFYICSSVFTMNPNMVYIKTIEAKVRCT